VYNIEVYPMLKALRHHHISFQHAYDGIVWAFRTQPNFRIHLIFSVLALGLGLYFRITSIEMTIIVFTILLGLAGEMINTALESVTDLVTTEWRQQAKIAKDVSAGMMLLIATGAVVVAIFIFSPYIIPLLHL
jgi:diacylglycerol kinase